jgi:hypothetical protein
MDGRVEQLEQELQAGLRRVAELRMEIDLASGKVPSSGVPHYTVIEEAAHELGAEVSRLTQQRHLRELTAQHVGAARCPTCERRCELEVVQRTVTSGDGPVELPELVGHCPSCRRDFFPAAGSAGVRRAGTDAARGPQDRRGGSRDPLL